MAKALKHGQIVWRVRKALKDAGLEVKSMEGGDNYGECTRLTTKSGNTYFTIDVKDSIFPPEEDY